MNDDELKAAVLEQYAQGVTVKDILTRNGIDYKHFWRIRNEAGVAPRTEGSMKWLFSMDIQEKICVRYLEGNSIRSLAIEYDVDRSVINGILTRLGVKKRTISESNKKKVLPEKEICECYQTSKSLSKTARRFNTTVKTVSRIVEKHGLKTRPSPNKGRPSQLIQHRDEIIDLYNKGLSITKIRERVGVNTNTTHFSRILRDAGVKIRTIGQQNSVYSVNQNYFSSIDSPIKAYVMGIIYTDGSVRTHPKKKFLIELHKDDEYTVELIKKEIGYTGPLYYTKKNSVILNVHGEKMVNDLVALGVVHNKTKTLTYPNWLRDDLIPHFMHGVLDGDGWASVSKNNNVSVGICSGAKIFFDGMLRFLIHHNIKFVTATTEDHNYRFEICSNNDRIRFLSLLFKDSPAIMKRKFLGFESILHRHVRKFTINDDIRQEAEQVCKNIRENFKSILCESSVS